ncbi:DNA-processing protein DprA [Bacteroides sp. AN502(2024)]|uniref:DNA-processing protein DprA n=1 Tax=Bacteroides sp. AN502(2024) TaxID=3160599 RepID=UPI003517E64D
MTNQELTYWVTLALMPKIWTKRKNEIYVNCFNHNPKISIIELFEEPSYWDELGLNDSEKELFKATYSQLANNSFLVEDMLSQGYDIIPLHSDSYPAILKKNLKIAAPTVIFTKGNKNIFREHSIAIVGSRKADEISLKFTDNVAKKASSENKIVVSGFAKGVDKQALDSALENGGKSIIVLPQGIMTFSSGFRQYYKEITQGRVLVMSTFAPQAPWRKELAMARNPIIYGMASDIFVAQSANNGGTWSGVIDGLRKKRSIYVRCPETNEANANSELIKKGSIPVDIHGDICKYVMDELEEDKQDEIIKAKIISILSAGPVSLKNILLKLKLEWSDYKMKKYLEMQQGIEKCKIKNRVYYSLKCGQMSLFE